MTAAAVATTPIGLVGCSSGSGQPAGIEKVTYVTGFGAYGREGYAWVAGAKGFYSAAGLEVDVRLGAAGDKNLDLVRSGRAQFACIDYAGAIVRAGRGQFDEFRLVTAINQRTLIALMAMRGGRGRTPKDLTGKRIAVATGSVPETLFPGYAKLAGIDTAGISWVHSAPQGLPGLLVGGKVDLIGQFVVGKPAIEHAAGGPVLVLPYSDFVSDLYGNVIVTTKTLAAQRPDLVRRFTGALLQGLAYTVAHPQESAAILHAAVPTTDAATAQAEMQLMGPYVGQPAGVFDRDTVARSIALVQAIGLIPKAVDPDQVVDFTVAPQPVGSSQ
jgi:NitT/TauT family transport system substrate-binding protein